MKKESDSNLYTIPLACCYALLLLEAVSAFVAAGEVGEGEAAVLWLLLSSPAVVAAAGMAEVAAAHCSLDAIELL